MQFFHFNQNNTGGVWQFDDAVTHHVVIEADSSEDADKRAEAIGIYFDGCESGMDCRCCGDRWYRTYGDGDDEPMVYGEPAAEYEPGKMSWWRMDGAEVYVYYKDGRKAEFCLPK
jgi:hypothetical protein